MDSNELDVNKLFRALEKIICEEYNITFTFSVKKKERRNEDQDEGKEE